MLVFLDFEASSLGKQSYPIEVAWVFEDGRSEAHLIRPAPGWADWDVRSEAIHRISRETLLGEGTPHEAVAQRMLEQLGGHDLFASAPSWDGKWLSTLLRAASLPRHSLRLRDTDVALLAAAKAILDPVLDGGGLSAAIEVALRAADLYASGEPPAHRALADAREEWARWQAVRRAAEALALSARA
ncbi:MAG: transcriptional regulator [Sphingomonas sp.]